MLLLGGYRTTDTLQKHDSKMGAAEYRQIGQVVVS